MFINILLWIGGIFITLAVFFISYRKTIGAKKERVKSANKEIVAILARTIANPQVNIDRKAVQSVIRSKAREYNVAIDDLNDMFMVLEDVMTKYIENEFISEDVKNTLVEKTKELLKEKEEEKVRVGRIPDISKDRLAILMSTTGAMIAMVTIIVSFGLIKPGLSLKSGMPLSLIIGMSATIIMATLTAFLKLALDRQKRIQNEAIYRGPMLEETVLSALEDYFKPGAIEQELLFMDGKRVDFVVNKESGKMPVEVKYILDSKSLSRAIEQLKVFMERLKSNKGLLIVNTLVAEKDKNTAAQNNIIIIENALSKQDIIRQLKVLVKDD